MTSIRQDYKDIDERIIVAARKLFSELGIMNTEMKDIASVLGIGRSTLYRHYSSKESILFVLAYKVLKNIRNSMEPPAGMTFSRGIAEVEWRLHALMERFIRERDDIVFLRDFDVFFTKGYPQVKEVEQFINYIRMDEAVVGLSQVFERGIQDESIRPVANPTITASTMIHSCIAIAQRVLPREELFLTGRGYAQEYLHENLRLMLDAVRA